MTLAAMAASLVDRYGQTVTYRRITASSYNAATGVNGQTITESTITAAVVQYTPKEIGASGGLIQHGDRKVVMPAAALAFTPKEGDSLTIENSDYRAMAVNSPGDRNGDIIHAIQVRGA